MNQVNCIDRSKARWGYVWVGGCKKEKRLILETYPSGGCVAVDRGFERSFLNGGHFEALYRSNYELLPETRPATHDEIVEIIAQRKSEPGFVWRVYTGLSIIKYYPELQVCESGVMLYLSPSHYQWTVLSPGQKLSEAEWKTFEVEEKAGE